MNNIKITDICFSITARDQLPFVQSCQTDSGVHPVPTK